MCSNRKRWNIYVEGEYNVKTDGKSDLKEARPASNVAGRQTHSGSISQYLTRCQRARNICKKGESDQVQILHRLVTFEDKEWIDENGKNLRHISHYPAESRLLEF